MLSTDYGDFNGNSWELLCQRCFKMKYAKEQYIDMPATPGDYGIEGFTKTGIVFQCYCPDKLYTQIELYEAQRNKITKDLKKLIKFQKELKDRLGDTKIREWHFYTPSYSKNEIIAHCTSKTKEYRKLGLSIIDTDFEVLPRDIDFLLPELISALAFTDDKITIRQSNSVTGQEVSDYRNSESQLIKNAIRKHSARFLQIGIKNSDSKVAKLTDGTIESYLGGRDIIQNWQKLSAEDYEKFTNIQSLYESDVEELCMFPSNSHNTLLKEITRGVESRLKENFSHLDGVTIDKLKKYIIADWILRCPIDFE